MKNYLSFDLLHPALIARGYSAQSFKIGKTFTQFTAPNGRVWLTRNGMVAYPFVDLAANYIAWDKQLSQNLASSHGLSTATTLRYDEDANTALAFLVSNAPIIVKPSDSHASKGLTLNITDEAGLLEAVGEAQKHSGSVLLQKQFFGDEIRITIVKGAVRSAIKRQTPRVIGDGASTVAELIVAENEVRTGLAFTYMAYPQLTSDIITDSFFSDTRVPEKGEVVLLGTTTLVSKGASLYDVTNTLHESYKAAALELVTAINPDFLVIDMIIQDIEAPLQPDNYIFLEITTSPALKMYYSMRNGSEYDIVTDLVDMIDQHCAV